MPATTRHDRGAPPAFRRHLQATRADPALTPYSAREVAAICGLSLCHFRRVRRHLHALDKLPPPYKENSGKLAFDRARVDAWRAGRSLPEPANDTAPTAASDAEQRAALQRQYAGATP